MAGSEKEKWTRDLAGVLHGLLKRPDAPVEDIEWLLLRCEDTLQYQGQLRDASVQQLDKDVRAFEVEFPGWLPRVLLDGPGS
ncbi:hypothetical protein [Corallococcus carmarthensis]|uniref:hypothetical protein n=1 Tax=Corallococcus carmarthensis TaxID=2316728 RepID=UPI0011C3D2AE|nr:hypothetical protein [Corallococcus carmarthensis]